jgi:hypothetical protein
VLFSYLLFRCGLYWHREAAQFTHSAWLGTFGGTHQTQEFRPSLTEALLDGSLFAFLYHWPKVLTPGGYANRLCLDSMFPVVAWETSDGGFVYYPDGPDGRAIASGGGSGDECESGTPDPGDRDGAGWLYP